MWIKIAELILKYRIALLFLVAAATAFFAYQASSAFDLSQNFPDNAMPSDDAEYIKYCNFRKEFGADNNTLLYAFETPNVKNPAEAWSNPAFLNDLYRLSCDITKIAGVKNIINLSQAQLLLANDSIGRFESRMSMTDTLKNKLEGDSVFRSVVRQKIYEGLLLNKEHNIALCAVVMTDSAIRTKQKVVVVKTVTPQFEALAQKHGLILHSAGVTFLRTYLQSRLPLELGAFMALSLALSALTLYIFYRSRFAVIFPLVLLTISAIISVGFIGLLGYKLSILTAMLPPIIVILGIPPSIYMISDYHQEYIHTKDKLQAIRLMIQKLGLVTLMINANTAFGFLTLYFTTISMLQEFGMVAFLGTMASFVVTIILLPGCLSLLPPPTEQNLKYMDERLVRRVVSLFNLIVINHKKHIYITGVVLTVVSIIGMTRLIAVSYMVDDLPKDDRIYLDVRFMEKNFNGVMPFEIMIDARKKGAFQKLSNLKKLDAAQRAMEKYPQLSHSRSVVDALRYSRQALAGGDPEAYQMPDRNEMEIIALYLAKSRETDSTLAKSEKRSATNNLVDSTYQKARITCFVQDIGSNELPVLMANVKADLDSIFNKGKTPTPENPAPDITLTGITHLFVRVNGFLIENLVWSLIAVFVLIGLQMYFLFGSFRIMVVSMIPNLIPLVVTAGMMGFLNIPLKPSTALIYELAFGIAIDNSIHYLAAYRAIRKRGVPIREAVSETLLETGVTIVFTSIVLFTGFVIFIFSAFGSTQALGILTSLTLFIAMFSNLLLMPVLLIHLDRDSKKTGKALIDAQA